MCYSYNKEQLLSFRHSEVVNNTKLPIEIFSNLRKLGINNKPKTHRGYSGGRNLIRQIPTIVSNRSNSVKNNSNYNPFDEGVLNNVCTNNNIIPIQLEENVPIETIIGHRPNGPSNENTGVNQHNLPPIKITNTPIQTKKYVSKQINFGLWNSNSVRNKTNTILNHIMDNDLDFLALTETKLKGDDSDQISIGEMCPPGYRFLHVPRPPKENAGVGGGVGMVFKNTLDVKMVQKRNTFNSFEYMEVVFTSGSNCVRIIVLYRSPSRSEAEFFKEFPSFADIKNIKSEHLLLIGDFNFHMDKPETGYAAKFSEFLSSGNYKQHVTEKTHKLGHILDLVITNKENEFVENIEILPLEDSDHHWIHFQLAIKKPLPEKKQISYRRLKNIDKNEFRKDIENSEMYKNPADNISDAFKQYNETLQNIFDKHAPLKSKVITVRPNVPWHSDAIGQAKRERRRAERKWRKTKLLVDRQIYCQKKRHVNKLCDQAKKDFYADKISECGKDQKQLFKVVNSLLHKPTETPLPSHDSEIELANRFAKFFTDKINKIRQQLATVQTETKLSSNETSKKYTETLSKFESATEDEIRKIIMKSATKSCSLDPIPTWLVKDCLESLLPVITRVVNLSLSSAEVPVDMKEAIVLPLIKKLILDPEILKNFRPVSNLSFLSKLIEKVVDVRFEDHLRKNNLHEKWQSAYKKFHSTETALLRVTNDILLDMDKNKCVLLVLLDLSAAFDTIDHETLMNRLSSRFGVKAKALSWFKSYLSERTQSVLIGKNKSQKCGLEYGVPQGSILGPKQFIGYTAPLSDIVEKDGLRLHLYADDTQIYLAFDPSDESMDISMEKLEKCISKIRKWMADNFLKLNDDKTEFLILRSKHNLKKLKTPLLHIGTSEIEPTDSARNIGAIFDTTMSMEKHVDSICKSAWYNLRKIGSIRKYLDTTATKTLVHAFIISRLDNLNSLLYGLPQILIKRLQRVQNASARLITRTRKYDDITPVLKELHWLPIKQRIEYKILLLTYKSRNDKGPSYLAELLKTPNRELRSKDELKLDDYILTKRAYGDRAFAKAAPVLWNSIPVGLRKSKSVETFKKNLKTYLFTKAFKNK